MIAIGGHDQEVAAWAGRALGVQFVQPLSAFGIADDDGHLKGAAIFNDFYKGGNIELTYLGPHTLTRKVIRLLADYAFNQCGAARVTAKTARSNKVAADVLTRLGFRYEAIHPRYYATAKSGDALVYVLFRRDAKRWLNTSRESKITSPDLVEA